MESSDSDLFDILFAGECLEGHDESAVRGALGKLFRADDDTLERLFSGRLQRIKSSVDEATARQYEKAMTTAGARCIVRAVEAAKGEPEASTSASPSRGPAAPQDKATADTSAPAGLTLAPPGSDVLRPEERQTGGAPVPDTQHLSIADPGADLGPQTAAPKAAPAVPDYEVAAVGSTLSADTSEDPPPAPDTSGIQLSEGDLDLSDCSPAPTPAVNIKLEHLSLAETGADLIDENERRRSDTQAPDTSHLSLRDPSLGDPTISDHAPSGPAQRDPAQNNPDPS